MKKHLVIILLLTAALFIGCPNVQIPEEDANDDAAGTYTLTVITNGTGVVTASPDKTKYSEGEVVTLTAAAGTDFIFDSWSGAASGADGSVSVTMDGDKIVTAVFKQLFTVSITTDGPGTVTVDPSKSEYIDGEGITLTAVPDTGKAFFRWTGDVEGYCHPARTLSVTGDMSVNAAFMDSSVYYVGAGESGDGSLDSPWGSIQTAIDNVPTPSAVFVCTGTYNESISVREGVSLYGGFSADFSDRKYQTAADRENAVYKTLLTSTTSGTAGGIDDPQTSFLVDGTSTSITLATIIEGFTIHGGTSRHEAAIACLEGGSPTIRYNTITGIGDGANTLTSYGIYVNNSAPTISHNIITGNTTDSFMGYGIGCNTIPGEMSISYNSIYGGDNCPGSDGAAGIQISNSAGIDIIIEHNTITGGYNAGAHAYGISEISGASTIRYNVIDAGSSYNATGSVDSIGVFSNQSVIYNNIISGGTAVSDSSTGVSYGIASSTGDPYAYNNTVFGGEASSYTAAIFIYAAGANIRNNVLFCSGNSPESYGIYCSSGLPDTVYNNNIFDTNHLYHQYDGASHTDYDTTAAYESYLTFSRASGNVSIDLIDNGVSYYFVDWDGPDNNILTLTDNDWRLTSDAPVNVRGGGLDLSVTFTDDYDGITRTTSTPTGATNTGAAGWSMGAFEED